MDTPRRPLPALSTDWPEGVGRLILAETDSTNVEAARRAPELAAPTWILAHRQTAGHGRRGRAWASPPGNFAATLVFRPEGPPERVALYSFVAALALFDALAQASGRPEALTLKWPNDVLLNGGKVAGILLESIGPGGGVTHLAIGIGVNLREAPEPRELEPDALRAVSLLSETGAAVTPEEFLDLLAPAFSFWQGRFSTYGFGPIREAWLAKAARLGQTITARTGAETISGRFETVDDRGNLVLSTPKGRRAIAAADIHF